MTIGADATSIVIGGNSTNVTINGIILQDGTTSENMTITATHSRGRVLYRSLGKTTSNNTATALTTDGAAVLANRTNVLTIADDSAAFFDIHVIGVRTDTYASVSKFGFNGVVLNDGGTLSFQTNTKTTEINTDAWDADVSVVADADANEDYLSVNVTGANGVNISWHAYAQLTTVF
jgi:hypothetical protein